ncbi:hypothetical protein [Mycetohabitans rhizoxinica]|uniref:Uncharacterized protein n=1 Tax=Mycetohabitans rhizoxinica TaxID=412963 RepID=A0ABZ2Q041_9BURK
MPRSGPQGSGLRHCMCRWALPPNRAGGSTRCRLSLRAPRFFSVGVDATQRRQAAFKRTDLLARVTQLHLKFSVVLRRILLNPPYDGIALLNQTRAVSARNLSS